MTDRSIREPPRVLVPVRVLEGQALPETLATFLAPADVVVLGFHVLPEQTPTEQASLQFEERARSAVEDIAAAFREAGGEAETRVAFTHDRDQTVERVAADVGATAILLPNPVAEVDDLLVAVRGAIDASRLADLVATLVAEGSHRVTVLGVTTDTDSDFDAGAAVADVRDRLRARGVATDRIETETVVSERPVADIVAHSVEFDAIVMGESEETLWSMLVGDEPERVAESAVAPVLVVRRGPATESTSG
jgi:nucleotide-binding universal stress UspA family protein